MNMKTCFSKFYNDLFSYLFMICLWVCLCTCAWWGQKRGENQILWSWSLKQSELSCHRHWEPTSSSPGTTSATESLLQHSPKLLSMFLFTLWQICTLCKVFDHFHPWLPLPTMGRLLVNPHFLHFIPILFTSSSDWVCLEVLVLF